MFPKVLPRQNRGTRKAETPQRLSSSSARVTGWRRPYVPISKGLGMRYRESETFELKKSTSEVREAVVSIAAILNKHSQGKLLFGIRANGEVIGQEVRRGPSCGTR
jgi:hypothetical protein